ncbi:MAG: hypothetical protein GY756_08945 [bacterium]|nr:hypothetical protein [bacterium]
MENNIESQILQRKITNLFNRFGKLYKKKYNEFHDAMMIDLHNEISDLLNNETPKEILNKALSKFDTLEFFPMKEPLEAEE